MSKIRKATHEDIDAIGKLWAALVIEENPNAHPNIERWKDIQRQLFGLNNYYIYVAEENGEVIGFNNGLFLVDIETNEPYIDGGNFYVLPKYRKGLSGMRLHRNSFEVAKSLGAKFMRRKVSANNKRMMDRLTSHAGKSHFVKEYIVDEMVGGLS